MFTIQVGHKASEVYDLSVSLAGGLFDGGCVYRDNQLIGFVEGDSFVAAGVCLKSDESAAWWLV